MRHRVHNSKLGTDSNHRKAIIKGLVLSLITHGSIETTVAKAKEASRVADKLIGKARVDTVSNRRIIHAFFGKRDAVNTLFERVAPVFTDRVSGFTRIVTLGTRRGDNSVVARLSLVVQPEVSGTLKKPVESVTATKPAEKKTTAVEKAVAAPKTAKAKPEVQIKTKVTAEKKQTAKKPAAKKVAKKTAVK
jgi:large subunit ribosomal protein L17